MIMAETFVNDSHLRGADELYFRLTMLRQSGYLPLMMRWMVPVLLFNNT